MEVTIGDKTFRLRELTFGDLLSIIEAGTENVFDPSGAVRQVTNIKKLSIAIIKYCVEGVADASGVRRLTEQDILSMPAAVAVRLVDECRRLNPFLAMAST